MPKIVNTALKANAKVKARTFEAKTKVIKLASRRLASRTASLPSMPQK